jgi:hypothetical protein
MGFRLAIRLCRLCANHLMISHLADAKRFRLFVAG